MGNTVAKDTEFGSAFVGHSGRLGEALSGLVDGVGGEVYLVHVPEEIGWTDQDVNNFFDATMAPTRASLEAFLKSPAVKKLGKKMIGCKLCRLFFRRLRAMDLRLVQHYLTKPQK